jgi:diguanylate cyclase (GGDEF)-like protein
MPPLLRSLAAQIIALVLGLLLPVQLVSFVVLRGGIDSNAQATIVTELRKGERVWRHLTEELARPLAETAARVAASEAVRTAWDGEDAGALAQAVAATLPAQAQAAWRMVLLDTTGQPRPTGEPQAGRVAEAWRTATAQDPTRRSALMWLDRQPYWVAAAPLTGPARTPAGTVLALRPLPRSLLDDAQALTGLTFQVLTRRHGQPWQEAWSDEPPSRRTAAVVQTLASQEHIPAAGREWPFQVGESWLARATPVALGPAAGTASALVILRSVDEAAAPFARLQLTLAALVALGGVITVTGGMLLARRMTRPLGVLAESARRLGRGDYERPICVVGTREVSELAQALEGMRAGIRERDQRITQLAYTDPLTHLPNRQQFLKLLAHRLKPTMQGPAACAVLMLNLDRFRLVNEALGRPFGDRLLREVGRRLGEIRAQGEAEADNDIVARLGADTFAMLLARPDRPSVLATCLRIQRAFEKPVRLDEHRIDLSTGIGAAIAPGHGSEADLLVGRAETAMLAAKRDHAGYYLFEAAMDTATPAALSLLGELRQAIEKHQLRVYLQPRVDMASQQVIGAEALMRWQHPRRGLLPPGEFIAFAEQTGFVRQLTAWMLVACARAARDLADAGLPLRVGMNLSTRDLRDDLPQRLQETLQEVDLPGSAMGLEITETAMMDDPEQALRALQALAQMGLHLSIDDFGTGYSSLSYLKRLPVHELKIDKSFVMRMEENLDDARIVRSTIELAHNLGLSVVAEGVESTAAWKLLAGLHCDHVQGFLIAEPMPVEEFAAWCRHWRAPSTESVELATEFREML